MYFLVNIISPFPITDVHQLHAAKINRLMAVSHCKTGIWIRGKKQQATEKLTNRMFQCTTPQDHTLTSCSRGS